MSDEHRLLRRDSAPSMMSRVSDFRITCSCGWVGHWDRSELADAEFEQHLKNSIPSPTLVQRDPEALPKLDIQEALDMVTGELARAMRKHPKPFYSAHDGWAKMKEEFDEMWDEIKKDDPVMTRKECTHVGAMALRYLIDITTK